MGAIAKIKAEVSRLQGIEAEVKKLREENTRLRAEVKRLTPAPKPAPKPAAPRKG